MEVDCLKDQTAKKQKVPSESDCGRENSATRQYQQIAGGSSNARPYSVDENKVRWLGLIAKKPQREPSSPLPPAIRKSGAPLTTRLKEADADSQFTQSFQKVANELEALCAAVSSLGTRYRQELSDLRTENMALNLQIRRLHANRDAELPMDHKSSAFSSAVSIRSKSHFSEDSAKKLGDESEMVHFESEMIGKQSISRGSIGSGETRSSMTPKASQSGNALGGRFRIRPAWDVQPEEDEETDADLDYFDECEAPRRSWNKKKHKDALRSRTSVFDMSASSHAQWTLHPYGKYRIVWNLLSLIAITYDIFMIPLAAFEIEDMGAVLVIEWILTLFWTLDVVLTFMTGFHIGTAVEMRPYQIAKNYAQTWLACDLTLVILEWMARLMQGTKVGSIVRSSRIFRIVRCVRLIRLGKLRSLMLVVEDKINSTLAGLVVTLLKLIAALLILVHCITCGWYALGESSEGGWTAYYAPTIAGPRDLSFWYFASSRWTLAQINGRTDMDERRTIIELSYTCVVAVVFAVIFMAVFISSITTTMMELQTMAASQTSTQRLLREYFAQYNITPRLIVSVKRHIQDFQNVESEQDNESKIMSLLPRQLANDLLYEVRAPTITSNMLLYSINQEFPRVVRHICHAVVTSLPAHKWEVMFDRGDACNRVLFVERGEILYSMEVANEWSPDFGDPDAAPPGDPLKKGVCISEAALWMYWENCGRLIAGGPASLLTVGAVVFEEHLRDFKVPHTRASAYAKKYIADLRERVDQGLPFTDVERPLAFGVMGRSPSSGLGERLSTVFWLPGRFSEHRFSSSADSSNYAQKANVKTIH